MSFNNYLKDRKNKRLQQLILEHAGRCRAVGKSFNKAGKIIESGNKNDLKSRMAIIKTEERSADEVEAKINHEVAISNLPTKLGEDLLLFVRTLDRAAGACKRSVINMELLSDFNLPETYAKMIVEATEKIQEIFDLMEEGLENMESVEKIKEIGIKINSNESIVDNIYINLKRGYFEIEKSFNSSAAMIILDHAFRDLEASADYGEDASELLLTLISRRG